MGKGRSPGDRTAYAFGSRIGRPAPMLRSGAAAGLSGRRRGKAPKPPGRPKPPISPEELRGIADEISREYSPLESPARLQVMPVEPHRAHAYWSIPSGAVEKARKGLGPAAKPVLRVYGEDDGGKPGHSDQEVRLDARNWYLDVGFAGGRPVVAEIGLRAPDGRFHAIVRSNPTALPRGGPSASSEVRYVRVGRSGRPEPVESPPAARWAEPSPEPAAPAAAVQGQAARQPGVEMREEALRSLALASVEGSERDRLIGLVDRGRAAVPDGEIEGAARAQAIEAEKARRGWPAWLRSLTDAEVDAFYRQLLALGCAPVPDGWLSDEALAGAADGAATARAEAALAAFLAAAREAGIALKEGWTDLLRELIAAAMKGDEEALRILGGAFPLNRIELAPARFRSAADWVSSPPWAGAARESASG